jgi:hypothetical protein
LIESSAKEVANVVVYGYFAGAEWTKPILRYTRNIQLIAGILWDLGIVSGLLGDGKARLGNWVSIGLLSCYFVLHRREIRLMEEGEKESKKKEG